MSDSKNDKIEVSGAVNYLNVIDAFKFDEPDNSKPSLHGLPVKAADSIVELKAACLFYGIVSSRQG